MQWTRRSFLGSTVAGVWALTAWPGESRPAARPDFGHLRLAVAVQGGSPEQLGEEAKWAKSAGFERVQLSLWMQEPQDEDLQLMHAALEEHGLRAVVFGTYINPLDPGNSGYMGASQEAMGALARNAGVFGANLFVAWSGGYHARFSAGDPRNATGEAMDALVSATNDLLASIDVCAGRLAYEPYYPDILGSPARYAEFFGRMGATRRVGMVMDPPNFVQPAQYPERTAIMEEAFRLPADRIFVAHLKDIAPAPDGGIALPGPCDGTMNYDLYLTRLASLGRPIDCVIEHTGGPNLARHHDAVRRRIDALAARI